MDVRAFEPADHQREAAKRFLRRRLELFDKPSSARVIDIFGREVADKRAFAVVFLVSIVERRKSTGEDRHLNRSLVQKLAERLDRADFSQFAQSFSGRR